MVAWIVETKYNYSEMRALFIKVLSMIKGVFKRIRVIAKQYLKQISRCDKHSPFVISRSSVQVRPPTPYFSRSYETP